MKIFFMFKKIKKNLVILIAGVVVFVLLYAFVVSTYFKEAEKRSLFIESQTADTVNCINVDGYIVSIDPNKGEMTIRMDFEPKGKYANEKGLLNIDLQVYVNNSSGKQEHSFEKDAIMNPIEITLNLYDGLVTDYPFDKHNADFQLYTYEKIKKEIKEGETMKEVTEESDINNFLSFSGSVTGYKINASLAPEGNDLLTVLNFEICRSDSVKFFSMFVVFLMWMLIILLLTLIYNVVVKGRKLEIGFLTFSASLLFAFPAFRNVMPMSPPIGSFPDYIAFFWAESMAAATLITFIMTWIKRKPQDKVPDPPDNIQNVG